MLRVALTGGLGAGKSTAGRMFRALGAHLLSSDEMGRELMQPGQQVYTAIVQHFGIQVELPGGGLDRAALGRLAFTEGRVEELNSIVHPAVISRQAEIIERIAREDPGAVVMVESALVFETLHGGADGWAQRFDKVVLVTAPEEVKIARYVDRASKGAPLSDDQRAALEAEARNRLVQQIPDERKAALSDYVLINDGPVTELEWQVDRLWPILQEQARSEPKAL
jgi:dephospho-CoA kinase